MTRVQHTARFSFAKIASGVTHESPLEDVAKVVYTAAVRYAEVNHFESKQIRGTAVGYQGKMVMSRLVRDLFGPLPTDEEYARLNGLINQVLRKSAAAVCIHHAPDTTPTWWINQDANLDDLVVIAVAVAKGHHGRMPSKGFDEKLFLRPGEKKLRPEETGENLPPGEVTVKRTKTEQSPAQKAASARNLKPGDPSALEAHRARMREMRERTLQVIVEEVATNQVPLSRNELSKILTRQYTEGNDVVYTNESTIGNLLNDLVNTQKLVFRDETPDERRVRGGGSMPAGKSQRLFSVFPGPVPVRTKLPTGITPATPMQDHQSGMKAQRDADDAAILDAMRRNSQARSSGVIVRESGLPVERGEAALQRLVSRKTLTYFPEHGRFQFTDRVRTPGVRQTSRPQPQPAQPTPPNSKPAPVATVDVEEVVSMVRQLAAGSGLADAAQLTILKQQVASLEQDNEKLRKQVKGLRDTLAAME